MDTAVAPAGSGEVDPPARSPWRIAVSGIGQTLITAGVIILLFVAYELWWTGFTTRHYQHQLLDTLHRQWAHGGPTTTINGPPLGSGIAILRIPRFGRGYHFVVVQGTSTADLIKGPGHYPGTAMPGQVGNFAVAGHRTTYLHPFYNLNELKPGDPIVLETRTTWLTYRVQNIPRTPALAQEIVSPSDVSVAYPVPDQPDASKAPTQPVLTFTSCNPRYSASQRIVVHALLAGAQPKADGLPPALAGEAGRVLMYVWIWRKLPGGIAAKLLGSVVLVAAVVVLLFLVVFPWASPKLPFNHVTVDPPPSQSTTHSPAPHHPHHH